MSDRQYHTVLPAAPQVPENLQRAVTDDYRHFAANGPPDNIHNHVQKRYRLDLETEYAGYPLQNPWGKASGQLSMTARQIQEDVDAGLGFVVLKTVIAQDQSGAQAMEAWATKESRMVAERILGKTGEQGWTVSWKGRGWWHSLEEYLQLVRESQALARGSGTLIVPSCKYHLPSLDEQTWMTSEYDFTTQQLISAWSDQTASAMPMPLEKDFSPTLAGSERATAKARILEWLRKVPELVRLAGPAGEVAKPAGTHPGSRATPRVRLGLKIFNSLYEDDFQLHMLRTIHELGPGRPDFFIYANRLFDAQRTFDGHRGIAYGGPDLSDRNLRVMLRFQRAAATDDVSPPLLPWSATGNICNGKLALEYALRGASSFQIHTFFQLPADQYAMKRGSKIQKALHELYFHPNDGLVIWMHHLGGALNLRREPLRFRDVVGRASEVSPRS